MLWENLRSEEFKDAVKKCNGVCVIPIGCVEAHGIHMPLGCDTIKAREFALRASEQEPVCVFPAMYFGEKSGAGEYPGTIIFPDTLIWEILEHSCYEIARNGFKKIIILSSHGGNTNMINAFVRNILQKKPDFIVFHFYQKMAKPDRLLEDISRYPYLTDEDIKVLESYVAEGKNDGHGGFVETACLYDICPEYVAIEKMNSLDGTNTGRMTEFSNRGFYTPFGWMANFPNSLSADAHEGLNARIAKAIAQQTVADTAAGFKFIREETISDEFHKEWLAKQN